MFFKPKRSNLEALLQEGYRYAQALRTDQGEARGLVHEAWLKVSVKHSRLPDKALLFRTIRNLNIDLYGREQKIQFSHVDAEGVEAGEQMGDRDVSQPPDAQLHTALTNLRDIEREALMLSVVEGYTAQEIGELLQLSRGTVLSLIHRARAKLKYELSKGTVVQLAEAHKMRARR